jgi:hypothetical protein
MNRPNQGGNEFPHSISCGGSDFGVRAIYRRFKRCRPPADLSATLAMKEKSQKSA